MTSIYIRRWCFALFMTAMAFGCSARPVLAAQNPEAQRRQAPAQAPARPDLEAELRKQLEAAQAVPQDQQDARETRERLHELLRQHPPSVAQVLGLDPSLLTRPDYMNRYPALSAFIARHPEVAHNPAYFFGTSSRGDWDRNDPRSEAVRIWRDAMQGFMIFVVIGSIAAALGWLVRTLIDYRRWLRLSKVQTEVHTKLLDRFASNEDLLAYVQSPAGRRFLESAPIPIDAPASRPMHAPFGRILWSVQAGFVLALGGVALMWVSNEVSGGSQGLAEVATPIFVMGALGIGLGVGFIASAVIAYGLSRRLGLLEPPAGPAHGAEKAPAEV
jgi:hypothetical protein